MENKFTWDEMLLCKDCHYADKDPSICNARERGGVKPGKILFPDDCGKYLKESKWKRMRAVYLELKEDEKAGKLTPYTQQILNEYEKYCSE